MELTLSTVPHYLIQRGILDRTAIVDGDLLTVDCSRRNRNFKVVRRNGPSYFVKQVLKFDEEATTTLRREAHCYWLAHSGTGLAGAADWMPRLFAYDTSRHVLVLELIPGGETLAEYQRRCGGFPVHAASQLGGLLGAFHHAAARGVTASMQPLVFPRRVPWVLSIHQQQPEFFPALSAGNAQLLEIVKRYSDFAATLDPLRAQWRRDGLMHGDLKWDNCILHANGGNPASLRWKLIDWEMGDEGDFAWDIATLLQAFLVNWVLSLPLDDRAITMADLSLEQMQPAMAAFWSSYVAARCFAEEQSHSELMRCVSYAGARMIQSAFECLYYAPQMTPPALRLLQASLNVLTRPEEARETLFGL